ncbi:hypothetical protein EDC04DRAFT_2616006 [Pisolithus marmoratus]|nr:hypothetical protein EDC04DRAFT_2616006 [Pisolithus marmoratus]
MATVKRTLSYIIGILPSAEYYVSNKWLDNTLVLISQFRWSAVSNRQQLMRSVTSHLGGFPSARQDDNAIELPAKRSMARSFSINHDMLPESKPLLVSFGWVPKCKAEGHSPGPPPKKRAIKSPSTCHVHFEGYPKYANYCRTFLVIVIWLQ